MGTIPEFDREGMLPKGDFEVTFSELRRSVLVRGNGLSDTWDAAWRHRLVDNLEIMAGQLVSVGIHDVFVDGSFVEDKDHPNDIDGYFVCDMMEFATGTLASRLNRLDPHRIWTWSSSARRSYRGYPKKQLPMWHQYRVELYPHFGQGSGIRDEFENELTFPAAFRRSRMGTPRGIVKIGGLR